MSYTIDYQITKLDVTRSLENLIDVITAVHFTITIAEDGFETNYSDYINLEPGDTFVDFDDVSKQDVIDWVKARLWQGPNTEELFIQQKLSIINDLKNPVIVNKFPNSWAI